MRLFLVQDALRNVQGHAWNETLGIRDACRRRRIQTRVYVDERADAELARRLEADRVFPGPPDHPLDEGHWSTFDAFVERGNRFACACRSLRRDGIKSDDDLWLPTATPEAILGLGLWAREAGAEFVPRIALNFVFDDFLGDDSRYNERAALYRMASRQLMTIARDRVIWTANTETMCEALESLLEVDVSRFPMPMNYDAGTLVPRPPRAPGGPLRVSILGEPRSEKGGRLTTRVVRGAPSGFSFFVQTALAHTGARDELAALESLPSVTVHRGALERENYLAALRGSDVVLLPYDARRYARRTSGVFAEAVGFGKPVIVPRGTWMEERIRAGEAAGVPFYEANEESVLGALRRVSVQETALTRRALEAEGAWRRAHSAEAYLDRLLDRKDVGSRLVG